jgi:hypothetical protein
MTEPHLRLDAPADRDALLGRLRNRARSLDASSVARILDRSARK